jgi:hypothetical protein
MPDSEELLNFLSSTPPDLLLTAGAGQCEIACCDLTDASP